VAACLTVLIGNQTIALCIDARLSDDVSLCQLIASLSVILRQLDQIKLELEYLKSGFKYKKKDINTDKNFLHHSSSTFFVYSSNLF